MKTRNSIIGLALIAFMASCSGTKTITDKDNGADFTKYYTYQLKADENAEGGLQMNEINMKRIENAIDEQLRANGMSASDTPDAYIIYGTDIDIQKGYTTNSTYHGGPYGYGRRGRYYGGGFSSSISTTTETQTANGIISIAMYDAETDELLWISHGTKEINPNSKKAEENINKSIAKMFKEFPIEHNFELGSEEDNEAFQLERQRHPRLRTQGFSRLARRRPPRCPRTPGDPGPARAARRLTA